MATKLYVKRQPFEIESICSGRGTPQNPNYTTSNSKLPNTQRKYVRKTYLAAICT
ncbi:hypothetical protein M413DRAFT_437940 [Hebeloma cylindrosporum]|uniref:Uncharacterized protein n=1 Tax=Hebeloma cylindrosporum TaxID=76867 RepID=A0A0C3CY60_HEBCY|nr:hypothetical protein M413DRAFT_437940 [Hebeloma cylindrosporum h7]